jgi:hypothetical protein
MKALVSFLVALTVLLAGIEARAQSDMIIKQRAKDLANQNNAQQGVPPPGTPPPPAAPAAPPPSPAEQEMQQHLDKFQAALADIKSGAEVSADQKQTLQNDLTTLVRGSVRPSEASLSKLTDSLITALSAPNVTMHERGQLAQGINAVVNSSMIGPDQARSFVVVSETSLRSSGVDDASVQAVSDNLTAIINEVLKRKPKLYQ